MRSSGLTPRARRTALFLCVLAVGCGQKGPPLAPLHLVPGPVTELSARRVAERARLQFVLPVRNANGPGPIDLDHVEVFAITAPPGVTPPNRALLQKENVVARLEVRPPPVEGEPTVEGDTRPGPGDRVTIDEELTEAVLAPDPALLEAAAEAAAAKVAAAAKAAAAKAAVPAAQTPDKTAKTAGEGAEADAARTATPAQPAPARATDPATATPADTAPTEQAAASPSGQAGAGGAAPAAAAPPPAGEPRRVYIVRGVTRSGRPGALSPRVTIPILPIPPPPVDLAARITEKSVVLQWKPNPATPALAYNVYRAENPMQPLNPKPLAEPTFEDTGAVFGKEHCYRVRGAGAVESVAIEGHLSEPVCITPRDVFPPAAPTGVVAVATPGQVSLIWDTNREADLAGYLVLRGQAGTDTLQALMASPLRETSFTDTTVKPGVRYVYAVVAVDAAEPPNPSPQSARVEETAR